MAKTNSREARGYGHEHRLLRRNWARSVNLGLVNCARCGKPIIPGQKWDLGHVDDDRTRYAGPEHLSCNRSAGGKPKKKVSRQW